MLDGVKVAFLFETDAVCAAALGVIWSEETADLSPSAVTCGGEGSVMGTGEDGECDEGGLPQATEVRW